MSQYRPFEVSLRRWVGALAIVGALLLSGSAPTWAQQGCPSGFRDTFLLLKWHLGPVMGDPASCVTFDRASRDYSQKTSTGLAYLRGSTGTPTFTDGATHWAHLSSGVVSWTSDQADPPESATLVAEDPPAGAPQGLGVPVAGAEWQVTVTSVRREKQIPSNNSSASGVAKPGSGILVVDFVLRNLVNPRQFEYSLSLGTVRIVGADGQSVGTTGGKSFADDEYCVFCFTSGRPGTGAEAVSFAWPLPDAMFLQPLKLEVYKDVPQIPLPQPQLMN